MHHRRIPSVKAKLGDISGALLDVDFNLFRHFSPWFIGAYEDVLGLDAKDTAPSLGKLGLRHVFPVCQKILTGVNADKGLDKRARVLVSRDQGQFAVAGQFGAEDVYTSFVLDGVSPVSE